MTLLQVAVTSHERLSRRPRPTVAELYVSAPLYEFCLHSGPSEASESVAAPGESALGRRGDRYRLVIAPRRPALGGGRSAHWSLLAAAAGDPPAPAILITEPGPASQLYVSGRESGRESARAAGQRQPTGGQFLLRPPV